MKVALEKEYRKVYTLEELEQAKMVIAFEKEDEETIEGWAEYAVREATKDRKDYADWLGATVIKATATTATNIRVYDAYGEGTGHMDVIIEATAETHKGFIKIAAYLSDIWQTGAVAYSEYMWVRTFKAEA